ncbi:MAG TPA: hypothetical protein VGL35_12655 [Rhizomicrobium sp.]
MRYSQLALAAATCVLLAGCDQNPKSSGISVKSQDGNVTISANGQNFSMKTNGDKNGSFAMSGNGGHFTMKASDGKQTVEINATGGGTDLKLPGFVAAYPGGKMQSTTIGSGAGGASGTFVFETADSPVSVIAWYKQKSADAGFKKGIDVNTGTTSIFTANAADGKKALQVIAATSGSGARVQVNWTGK